MTAYKTSITNLKRECITLRASKVLRPGARHLISVVECLTPSTTCHTHWSEVGGMCEPTGAFVLPRAFDVHIYKT